MKRRLIVSSFLTIVLCLCLIAGSTFALFTSESKLDVAVTSAKVKVTALLEDDAITKNFGDEDVTDAAIDKDDPSKIIITNFAPKDSVTVAVKLVNDSSIAIKYRLSVNSTNDFGGALKVTSSPIELDKWNSAKAGQTLGNDGIIYVTIEYLFQGGEDLQTQQSSDFTFTVEAVQANGVETRVGNANELKQAFTESNATDKHPVTIILSDDIVIDEPLSVKGNFILDTNGKTISTAMSDDELSLIKYPFVMTDASVLTIDATKTQENIGLGNKGLVEIPKDVSADVNLKGGVFTGKNADATEDGALVTVAADSSKQGNKVNVKMTNVTLNSTGIKAFSSKGIKNTALTLTVERSTFICDTSCVLADSCQLLIEDTKFETYSTAIELLNSRFASAERCEIILNRNAVGDIAGVSVANNSMIDLKHLSVTAPNGIPAYWVCDTNGQINVQKSTANTDTVTKIDHADGRIVIDGTAYTKE